RCPRPTFSNVAAVLRVGHDQNLPHVSAAPNGGLAATLPWVAITAMSGCTDLELIRSSVIGSSIA
ncbi:MAG: hypothetical protein ABI651_13470, partial [Verrucomicrobiota bacterium]